MTVFHTPSSDILIGTLVSGNGTDPADYIRQILPHGFESFQTTFWQTLGGANLPDLASRIKDAVGDQAVISSLAVFGNPLEGEEIDLQTLHAWESAIDHAQVYKDELEMTGQVHGLNYLKRCRTDFVPNPK